METVEVLERRDIDGQGNCLVPLAAAQLAGPVLLQQPGGNVSDRLQACEQARAVRLSGKQVLDDLTNLSDDGLRHVVVVLGSVPPCTHIHITTKYSRA